MSSLFLVVVDLVNISYTLFCPTGTPTLPLFEEEEDIILLEEGANLASGNF